MNGSVMKFEKMIVEDLQGEFGEKILLIRHDVDNIFDIYSPNSSKFKKFLNYLAILSFSKYGFLRSILPGYLHHLWDVLDVEVKYDVKATFFFRVVTAPTMNLRDALITRGHEIAYHSDRNSRFEDFLLDLKYLERAVKITVKGFTKHGFSPVRSGGMWNEKLFISYGVNAGLKYLAQGSGHPDWEVPRKVKGLWVFGHHITLKKISLASAEKYVRARALPLILVHPEDLFIKGEMEKFENVVSRGKCVTFIELIRVLEKLLREYVR